MGPGETSASSLLWLPVDDPLIGAMIEEVTRDGLDAFESMRLDLDAAMQGHPRWATMKKVIGPAGTSEPHRDETSPAQGQHTFSSPPGRAHPLRTDRGPVSAAQTCPRHS
ncbi:hypothetical protein [Acetobacter conturbans]|uniref:Uncharacterized protein n=1 Tax=Acetobacter conturbans TaxID=1737472 RepID=A0ABX0JX76_9PROT|nr:hypothetical protein [Acetobacter conturbans]NHN87929.1 hypothetical protein [Acetobacter conturbans]